MPKRPSKQKLATMNISLPASLRERIDEKIQTEGYGNASEYVRSLVRDDLRFGGVGNLERFIEEGLRTPTEPMGVRWLEARKHALRDRVARRQRRAG